MKPLFTVLASLLLLLCVVSTGAALATASATPLAVQPMLPSAAFPWRVQPVLAHDYTAAYFFTGWWPAENNLPNRFPEFPLCFYDYSPHYGRVFGSFLVFEPRFLWRMRNHCFRLDIVHPQDAASEECSDPLFFLGVVFPSVDPLGLRSSTPPNTRASLFPLFTEVPYWVPPP
ncbi:MAG: hypothetical protein JWR15_750 [Prosthecobacter sp.]|nr:hypothetical protein [Prosthecobacter sp.]